MVDLSAPSVARLRPRAAVSSARAQRTRDRALTAIALIAVVVLWEVAARTILADRYIIPAPSAIATSIWEDRELYWANGLATGLTAVIGYFVGQAIAVSLAVLLSLSAAAELVVTKLALVVYCLPTLAIAPILGTIFGLEGTRIAVVAIVVFFPTLLSTSSGLRAVTPETRALVHSLGGGRMMVLRKVGLRGSLPEMFSGLKLGAPGATLGAIASEWLGASAGLGIFMVNSLAYLQPVRVWGTCVVCVAATLIAYGLVALVDRAVNRWSLPAREALS